MSLINIPIKYENEINIENAGVLLAPLGKKAFSRQYIQIICKEWFIFRQYQHQRGTDGLCYRRIGLRQNNSSEYLIGNVKT